jgi:hypothetical protein
MARRKPNTAKKPSDRRRKAAATPAKTFEPALGDMERNADGREDGDLLDFQMSDDDIDSIDAPDSWDEGYVPEEEEDDDEQFRRRRRLRDDELKWEEEALGDWREMESYRREYNDR